MYVNDKIIFVEQYGNKALHKKTDMKILTNIAVSDSGYLFNPTNGDSFSSNAVATDIIAMMKQNKTGDEIKKALHAKYEVEKSTIERDYDEFIQELGDNYLLSSDVK